ncbi:hypothetical protein JX266_013002 [Neoarthrinium moseri]|nr:hypothetical protein JX266_013002 [Neoarthrinium moseri]
MGRCHPSLYVGGRPGAWGLAAGAAPGQKLETWQELCRPIRKQSAAPRDLDLLTQANHDGLNLQATTPQTSDVAIVETLR